MHVSNAASEWRIYRTRFLISARQLTESFSLVDALGREHHGEPGDYLVESSDGAQRIAPREVFEDIYVPIGAAGENWPVPDKRALPLEPAAARRPASRRAIMV